jgi:hypothetical protein
LQYKIKDEEFIDWAYEALEETNEKNQEIHKDSFEAHQTALDGVNRRIDNLIALKISPENDGNLLSDAEFADRKRGLMMEKETIIRQLAQCNPNGSDWASVARDAFDFALLAKDRFDHGESEDKRVIFKAIGVNPILLDQKLNYQPRFIFMKIQEGAKKTNDEIDRLEPQNSPSNRADLKNYIKSSVWCAGQELNLHRFLYTLLRRARIPFRHPRS